MLYACKGVQGSEKAMGAHTGQREREKGREVKQGILKGEVSLYC